MTLGVVVGAVTVVSPGTALANATVTIKGARAVFVDLGEHLKACDTLVDGRRAVARVAWPADKPASEWTQAFAEDVDGADGDCHEIPYDINIPEGTTVLVTAWIQDGKNGTAENYTSVYTTA